MSGLSPELQATIQEWLKTPWRFAEDTMRWDGDHGGIAPLRLEQYQRDFMQASSKYRAVNKSRQVGYSFIFGVESLTRAILDPGHTSMFVSYNLDDSKEKVSIIHKLVDSSPALQTMAQFDLLKADVRVRPIWSRRWSTIRSLPCRPVRGKTKADLYLDEIAHYADARDVYLGSVPATVRAAAGAGQITVASTPNGKAGIFWECVDGARARPFWQQRVPWWASRYLCKNPDDALPYAADMPTEERVRRYGLPNLQELYDGMALIDFQQEFECDFVDDGATYYPMELLRSNMVEDTVLCKDMDEVRQRRHPEGSLFLGVDIGRHKDTTEVVIIDRFPDDTASTGYAYVPLMVVTMDRWDTQRQGDELERYLAMPEIFKMWIDTTGIGLPIGERLKEAYPNKVQGVVFTTPVKEHMAVLVRRALERNLLDLPDSEAEDIDPYRERKARELIDHIHSIKRSAGVGRHAKYEAESTTHHGDQFWALALAMLCAYDDLKPRRDVSTLRDELDDELDEALI